MSDGLFCTRQVSQLQPDGALNISPNPVVEEVREVEVVEEEAPVDCVEVCSGVSSGLGEVRATGEAKPLSRSSTLPCFRVLAGLNGPSNSSVLLLVAGFTAAATGVASFPLDMEGPNFATGALKVNSAERENEGGLVAVALTIGEENVKGTQGGVEAVGGSLFVAASLAGVTGATLWLLLLLLVVVVAAGGRGEVKLNVGKAEVLMGREMLGRSGTSDTSSSSGRLEEGRVVVLSRFILPPPDPTLLAAGVLDRG